MRVPESILNEIKSRIRLSDLVGRKVALKKQGKEFAGLSPFTAEKSASFFVNDEKQFFKDFSSGKFGDCFGWLIETERMSFIEAVERLAQETGVSLPRASGPVDPEIETRARLYRIMETACTFFERELRGARGTEARAYLEGRGLSAQTWGRHEIGYAPAGWRNLLDHFKAQGISEADCITAGLGVALEEGRAPYDRFRNRVMFAIRDPQGRLCAFGGRSLSPEDKPKYLNSPETPIFHKRTVLYRYPEARRAAAEQKARGLIVVEGYIDAIALAEAGFGHGVAPLGTALGQEQLDLLWKIGPEPIICLDGDRAGQDAAYKAIDIAMPKLEPGRSLYFATLPQGLDPDELIRKQGAAAMGAVLQTTKPMIEALWEREQAVAPLDTPERRAAFETRLRVVSEKIAHPIVRRAYAQELTRRLRALAWSLSRPAPSAGRSGDSGAARPSFAGGVGARSGPRLSYSQITFSERGLGLVMQAISSAGLIERAREAFARLDFDDPDVEAARDAVLDVHDSESVVDVEAVERHLRTLGRDAAANQVLSLAFCVPQDPRKVNAPVAQMQPTEQRIEKSTLSGGSRSTGGREDAADMDAQTVFEKDRRGREWLEFVNRLAAYQGLKRDAEKAKSDYIASLSAPDNEMARRSARDRHVALSQALRNALKSLDTSTFSGDDLTATTEVETRKH